MAEKEERKDWHHLLDLCSIFGVLLADQDGVYDPADPNDRLLLGLKGTMSEAELHTLKARMHQGLLHKARRGEVFNHPPIGYVKSPKGGFDLDPDAQVRGVVQLVFDQFERQGTVCGLLRYLVSNNILIPVRPHQGPQRGQRIRLPANSGRMRRDAWHPGHFIVSAMGSVSPQRQPARPGASFPRRAGSLPPS